MLALKESSLNKPTQSFYFLSYVLESLNADSLLTGITPVSEWSTRMFSVLYKEYRYLQEANLK